MHLEEPFRGVDVHRGAWTGVGAGLSGAASGSGTPGGTRTHNRSVLSRLPLPIGLPGPVTVVPAGVRRTLIGTRLAPVNAKDVPPEPELELPTVGEDVAEDAGPAGAGPTRRAVVAEDEALIRMDVVETLREAGFEVVGEAGDGETAVNLALELRPDVVVMDVSMPRMNGIEATRVIGQRLPFVRVVGMSMHERDEMASAMMEAGAVAYVTKGGPSEQLISQIRRAAQTPTPTPAADGDGEIT